MLKIIYSEQGISMGDKFVKQYVDQKIEEYLNSEANDLEVWVANEITLNMFVLRVMEGIIPDFDIEFYWENTKLIWDEYLGVEIPDNCTELGINLSIINRIIQIGAKKRLEHLKSNKPQS